MSWYSFSMLLNKGAETCYIVGSLADNTWVDGSALEDGFDCDVYAHVGGALRAVGHPGCTDATLEISYEEKVSGDIQVLRRV